MRKIALLLMVAACGTDGTTPTASGVFPAEGFTGRSLRVEISGDATTWKDGATVDFGAGVTVNAVDVASPTDLFADVTIDPGAAIGKNDVTVTNGSKKYTLTKAFELVSPTPITWSGDIAQGGVPFFTIENLDFSHQFDATQDQNTGEFSNTTVTGPAGTQVILSSVTPFEIQGQVFIDVNAAAGSTPFTIVSGATSATAATSVAGTIDIKARTPMAFSGMETISLPEKGSSQLYTFSATGATLIHYSLSGTSADSAPVSEVLSSGGTWASDALGASPTILETGGTGFILVESFGTGADTVTMQGAVDALTSAAEGADATNGTATGTTVVNAGMTLPFRQTGGMISTANDVDFVKFVAPAGSTGKHLHVTTNLGSDVNTNSVVEVDTGAAGATTFDGPHDEDSDCSFFCNNLGEDFVTTDPVTAGSTYWIRVSASTGSGFSPPYSTADKAYTLVFWLE
jgi:hypothetical protein